jgi:hypothetical protein
MLATLTKEFAVSEIDTAPAVTGSHHFSPTVSDVEASAQRYERVFAMNRIPVTFPHYGAEQEGYAVLLMDPRSGIAIGLHRALRSHRHRQPDALLRGRLPRS